MKIPNKVLNGETKTKKGIHHPYGYITDPTKTRAEETSRRERRMNASSVGGQGL